MIPNTPFAPDRPRNVPVAPVDLVAHADLIAVEISLLQAEVELACILAERGESAPSQPEPVNIPAAFAEAKRLG